MTKSSKWLGDDYDRNRDHVGSSARRNHTSWIRTAAQLPGKSLHLAVMIWLSTNRSERNSICIGNCEALRFGIDRNSKYRALAWLESAGLISVSRRLGRSPIVTLLEVELPSEDNG